jgi:uncharacterized protein (TIGR03086 family)
MTNRDVEVAVLSRGLDQTAALLDEVREADLPTPTPCEDWTVSDLVDHLVRGAGGFARVVRGEDVDWTAPTPHVESGWAEEFRAGANDLRAAWSAVGDADGTTSADWQSAELAVHTWDLATALGRPTDGLDPEVAERGLAFMQANLKPEVRTFAFKAEQPAPEGADAYAQIAAFAGRAVAPGR